MLVKEVSVLPVPVGQIQHLLAEGLVLVDGVVMDTVLIKTQLICLTVLGVMVNKDGYMKQDVEDLLLN